MDIPSRQLDPEVTLLEPSDKLALGCGSERLEQQIEQLLGEGRRKFIVDLSKVVFIDSAGVGALIACWGKVKQAGGQFRVAGAQSRVLRELRMTALDNVLPLEPSVDSALKSLGGS